jgi:hypothetical protein
MERRPARSCAAALFFSIWYAPAAHAQATGQLWGNATIGFLSSERLSYRVEVEPKTQDVVHAGQTTWFSVDVTPRVEYALAPWIDVLGEVDMGLKRQSDGVDSADTTPRFGVELHILSRLLKAHGAPPGAAREIEPLRRLVISTLLRFERSNSAWLLRDRTEFVYPLNRRKATIDGAVYIASDGELFIPIDRAADQDFVESVRVRGGVGYRHSFEWRFEALYIWDAGRNSADTSALAVKDHAINIRVTREF